MTALAALVTTLALLPAPSPGTTARDAAERLQRRVIALRAAEQTLDGETARLLLDEQREQLERAGFSTDLAAALTTFDTGKAEPASPARALGLVEARLRAFAAAAEAGDPTLPQDARARARAVLADPIFLERPAEAGPMQQLLHRISALLGRLFMVTASFAAANWRAIAIVASLILAYATYLVVRFAVGRLRSAERGSQQQSVVHWGSAPPEAGSWLDQARREIAAGRRLEALRLLAAAALLALRHRGQLPDEPGLTLLEALRHVRRSEVEPSLARLMELHERQVYAGGRGAGEDLEHALQLAESIVKPRVVAP